MKRHTDSTRPEQAATNASLELLATLSVFACALVVMLWRCRAGNLGLDSEGIPLVAAVRTLDGQIPYRDYWTIYAPGSAWLLAGLFRWFGTQLSVSRITGAVCVAFAPPLLYGIARQLGVRRGLAMAAGLLSIVVLYPDPRRWATYYTALPCMLAALASAAWYFRRGGRSRLFLAGFCVSLALVFKHDVGCYVGLALAGTLLARRFVGVPGQPAGPLLGELATLAAGGLSVALPTYAGLAYFAGPEMLNDLVLFPLTDFPAARPERYPSPIPSLIAWTSPLRAALDVSLRLRHWIPAAVFCVSVVRLARCIRCRAGAPTAGQLLLTVCIPFFWYAAHVQINTHIYTMTLLSLLLLVRMVQDWLGSLSRAHAAHWLVASVAVMCVMAWCPRAAAELLRGLRPAVVGVPLNLPRAGGIDADANDAEQVRRTLDYVRARTMPDEAVYVGLARHDVVIISSPLLYFLLDRPIPTRYHELHPAIADTLPVQEEIVRDIARAGVRYAVLWRPYEDGRLNEIQANRRTKLPQTGATLLDEYLRRRFTRVKEFGRFDVWRHQ